MPHVSVRIMDEARRICLEDGHDWTARSLMRAERSADSFRLELEVPKPTSMSDTEYRNHHGKLVERLAQIEGVEEVLSLGSEKVGGSLRSPVLPTEADKLEIKRIFAAAGEICEVHGRGAAINAVVPGKYGFLVDINFLPLESKALPEQMSIIADVEKRIKTINGVWALSYKL